MSKSKRFRNSSSSSRSRSRKCRNIDSKNRSTTLKIGGNMGDIQYDESIAVLTELENLKYWSF